MRGIGSCDHNRYEHEHVQDGKTPKLRFSCLLFLFAFFLLNLCFCRPAWQKACMSWKSLVEWTLNTRSAHEVGPSLEVEWVSSMLTFANLGQWICPVSTTDMCLVSNTWARMPVAELTAMIHASYCYQAMSVASGAKVWEERPGCAPVLTVLCYNAATDTLTVFCT